MFQPQGPPPKSGKSEEEIKEEEELQLALALSQSEAEEAEKQRQKRGGGQYYKNSAAADSQPAKSEADVGKVRLNFE